MRHLLKGQLGKLTVRAKLDCQFNQQGERHENHGHPNSTGQEVRNCSMLGHHRFRVMFVKEASTMALRVMPARVEA